MDRRLNVRAREDYKDPLGGYTDFDIVNYLQSGSDTPVDSPPDMRAAANNMHMHHSIADPQPLMFPGARLPDSPPITDISGAGSSASPSSNSDPPYSPDNYAYPAIHSAINAQGFVIGDVNNGMMLNPEHLTHAQRGVLQQQQHQLQSPQPCFMRAYPNQSTPNTMSQVSPPLQPCADFGLSNAYCSSMDMYNNVPDSSLEPTRGKRMHMDPDTKYVPVGIGMHQQGENNNLSHYDENLQAQQQPVIKFEPFEKEKWMPVYGEKTHKQLEGLHVVVVADKGFNYIPGDGVFVNQKKNHFQVTVHIEAQDPEAPALVCKNGCFLRIKEFKLAFCGVKYEMPTSEIQIKQSQTDRKPIPHAPVTLEINEQRITKVTVPRLHFNETTMNNQRKNNKLNPDQKYFLLVVRLKATTEDGQDHLIQSYHSERVVVRATNPGSFNPEDNEPGWRNNGSSLCTNSQVVISGEKPIGNAKLTLHGDMYINGTINKPSDRRLKEDITPIDPNEALENIQKLSVVKYFYKPEVAALWGLTEEQRQRTGLIAQELAAVMPDAVKDIGDYLTIDENRVFYETLVATQELCRLTGDLDTKIDEKLEEISTRLARYARRKKMLGSMASNLSGETGDNKSILSYSRSSLASFVPHKKDKERRGRSRSSGSQPLFGSRCTQGTIVGLVMIMALCLLVMSGLYVLDWHNRNFGATKGIGTLPATIIPSEPPASEGPLPIVDYKSQLANLHKGPPLSGHCHGDHCHSYCCSSPVVYSDKLLPVQEQDLLDYRPSRKQSEELDVTIEQPLPGDVSIRIPELNVTLDRRYCIWDSCEESKDLYTLYIPISPQFPNVPLEVQFSIPRGYIVNSCGQLSGKNKPCDGDFSPEEGFKIPTSTQIDDNLYEVTAGVFHMSGYRFRVGLTTESCYIGRDGHVAASFLEYNLIFYRKCSSQTKSSPPQLGISH